MNSIISTTDSSATASAGATAAESANATANATGKGREHAAGAGAGAAEEGENVTIATNTPEAVSISATTTVNAAVSTNARKVSTLQRTTQAKRPGSLMVDSRSTDSTPSAAAGSSLKHITSKKGDSKDNGADRKTKRRRVTMTPDDDDDDDDDDDEYIDYEEAEEYFDYDYGVDDLDSASENSSSKSSTNTTKNSWMTTNVVGQDRSTWQKTMKAASDKARKKVKKLYRSLFDIMVAQGCSIAQLNEMAEVLSTDMGNLSKFDKLLVSEADQIVSSGVSFTEEGDIFSDLVLPHDPTIVAERIVSEDKEFREEAGKIIDSIAGGSVCNLGQPIKKETLACTQQHWAVKEHKAQDDCPYNKIDDSSCNREIRRTIPLWLICDELGINYDNETASRHLPSKFDDTLRVADHHPLQLNKNIRKKSKAKKPPTDVVGQVQRFARKANTNITRLSLLPMLQSCKQSIVTKLMGRHNTFLIFSVTAYNELGCPPQNNNSLVHFLGAVPHAQNFVAAKKQFKKYEDDHLRYIMGKVVAIYSPILDLPDNVTSEMLVVRSGRGNMTEEQKQLLRDQGSSFEYLKKWLERATPKDLSKRSQKAQKTRGFAGHSEAMKKGKKNQGATSISEAGKKGQWKRMLQKALNENKEICFVQCSRPNVVCSNKALAFRNKRGGFELNCNCGKHTRWTQVGGALSRETIETILEKIDSMNGNESLIDVITKCISS